MPAPPHREEAIFSQAISLPAAGRSAYLDQACAGDVALRARVEALLRSHDEADSLLDAAPGGIVRTSLTKPSPEETPGALIGRYKLLQKIGEGGCGLVYMAEQEEPVRRRVALKVIKLGMDTREVIARFEAERQALALMDHPNIARVLDGGATATGRPYFVMELVRGVPITTYCDEQSLSTPARLGLFMQVCSAVQHAHQKGIIHRDLKPSNILVTVNDGAPVPKVIDFGIAKATQGRLTDHTLFTAFEQFIGTPAYMSPEQAELTSLDVDTRSDIYSLGVLLYELLTGRTPFDSKSLLRAGLDEIRRVIREVEPPRPSARLSTLTDADRATVAKLRATAPLQLSTLLRGDLDWIVMRCLEKDRRRRYETANGLAADIQRYLQSEPVVARPPSAAYRMGKFVHRHRLPVLAATAVVFSLIAGLVVSSFLLVRARVAERAESALHQQAEEARTKETFLASRTAVDLAGRLLAGGRTSEGLAFLVHAARKDPRDHTIPPRIASLLTSRTFLLAAAAPLEFGAQVAEVRYLHQGRTLAVYGEDGSIGFVDRATGNVSRTKLPTPLGAAGVLLVGQVTLVQNADGVIRVLDSATGRVRREFAPAQRVVALSARNRDAPRAVAVLADRSVIVLDALTGETRSLPFKLAESARVELSPDGRWLVRAEAPYREWQCWDLAAGICRSVRPVDGEFDRAAFSPDSTRLLVTHRKATQDYVFRLWSTAGFQPLNEPTVCMKASPAIHFLAVTFSPDGHWFSIASHVGQQVYAAETGLAAGPFLDAPYFNVGRPWANAREQMAVGFDELQGAVSSALFYGPREQPRFITHSRLGDGVVLTARDVATGEPVLPPFELTGGLGEARVSEDGSTLVTTGGDGFVRLWDLATGQLRAEPTLQQASHTFSLALAPDSGELAIGGAEGRVFRLQFGGRKAAPIVLPRPQIALPAPFLTQAPARLLWLASDGAKVIDIASGTISGGFSFPEPIQGITRGARGIAVRPDLRFMVVQTIGGVWQSWELGPTGIVRSVPLENAPEGEAWVCLAANSNRVALIPLSQPQTVWFWDLPSGKAIGAPLRFPIPLHASDTRPAAFGPGGRHFFAGTDAASAGAWDPETGKAVVQLRPWRDTMIRRVDVTADGTRIATRNGWGEAQLWDAATGRPLSPVLTGTGALLGLWFSPGGESLLTWSFDGFARVWDGRSGAPVSEPMLHHGAIIRAAAFSPDGQRVVTGGTDSVARIWDAQTGRPLTEPLNHPARVVSCAFSPDGRFIRTEHAEGPGIPSSFCLWSVPPADAPAPEWLLQLATICATKQVNETGHCIDVPAVIAQIADVRRTLATLPDAAPYVEWGRWFLADPATRPIAPGFSAAAKAATRLSAELGAP